MKVKTINLIDQKFGKLLVVSKQGTYNGKVVWLCECECGNEKEVTTNNLKNGRTKSCGCIKSSVSKIYIKEATKASLKRLRSADNDTPAEITNTTTGIRNIICVKRQKQTLFRVKIKRYEKKYEQYFSNLNRAKEAKKIVLERYAKGCSNWNEKL